ncbi:AMP-binding protein [Allokutzneria albata]|uniref:AMP-binding protein n=1 Tax=Allokutzneria albata TaxID=211114 RepID=UPI00138E026C|nr:AMP-binding protein [Allokutzneria albata]
MIDSLTWHLSVWRFYGRSQHPGWHRQAANAAGLDVSTHEVRVPLLSGGCVVVAPSGDVEISTLRSRLIRENITAIPAATGLFRVIAEEAPDIFANVQEARTGGDLVSPAAVRRVQQACSSEVLRGMDNPTEITPFASNQEVFSAHSPVQAVAIGQALDHNQLHTLDEQVLPVADEEASELCIAGAEVAWGYVGRPELVADRYLAVRCCAVVGCA